MSNNNFTPTQITVGYIVRDREQRNFLTRPTYSGRVRGNWGLKREAVVFRTREEAQSAASNINARRPEGYSAYFAEVRPLTLNYAR